VLYFWATVFWDKRFQLKKEAVRVRKIELVSGILCQWEELLYRLLIFYILLIFLHAVDIVLTADIVHTADIVLTVDIYILLILYLLLIFTYC
jgi:hypothetical protein